MFLVRENLARFWRALGAAAMVSAGVGGCANRPPVVVKTPEPVAMQPAPDQATDLRVWKRSLALYHSGATQAWPTRWYYAPNPDNTDVLNYVVDPTMAIVQTITLPAVLTVDYPFRKVVYAGDVVPLSYTAMPPLPPTPPLGLPNPDPDPLSAPQEPVLPPLPPIPVEVPPMVFPAPKTKPASVKHKPAKMSAATQPVTRE